MLDSIKCFQDFIAACKAGDLVGALQHFSHLAADAASLAKLLTEGKVFAKAPDHLTAMEAAKAELEALAAAPAVMSADPVGKLGDGVLLKQLIELAIKILPLFL